MIILQGGKVVWAQATFHKSDWRHNSKKVLLSPDDYETLMILLWIAKPCTESGTGVAKARTIWATLIIVTREGACSVWNPMRSSRSAKSRYDSWIRGAGCGCRFSAGRAPPIRQSLRDKKIHDLEEIYDLLAVHFPIAGDVFCGYGEHLPPLFPLFPFYGHVWVSRLPCDKFRSFQSENKLNFINDFGCLPDVFNLGMSGPYL